MKIGFIGLGKLGMPCALAINMKGHDVIGYDVNPECMQKDFFQHREIGPNGEPSIEPLLKESSLKFGSLEEVIKQSEIIFVPIQTPHEEKYEGITRLPEERKDFEYKYLIQGLKNISKEVDKIEEDKIVIIISTVLPGTTRKHLIPILSKRIKLCYNPFFIAMGTVIKDFLDPEFVLFGVYDEDAAKKAEEFYKTIHDKPFYKTTIENAELIKVAYNTFISMKICFVNTLMEICHKSENTNVDEITNALKMATDRLISTKYLTAGVGDGGGCFLPDQIVYTENGPKIIKDIEIGEKVLSGNGYLQTVVEIYKRPYKGYITKIKARGLPIIKCTPEHSFIVSEDLRKKYMVNNIVKRIYLNNENKINILEEKSAIFLNNNYYAVFPKPNNFLFSECKPNHVNETYIELAGYYLSEGSIWFDKNRNYKPRRVDFYFNKDEVNYINDIKKLSFILYENSNPKDIFKTGTKCRGVRLNNTDLAFKLFNDFGKNSYNKKIPSWILFNKEKKWGRLLIKGMFRGDGSSHKEGFNFTTISKNLAYGVNLILRENDIPSTIQEHEERIGKDGIKHKKSYEIRIRNSVYMEKMANITGMNIKHKMQEKKYPGSIFQYNNNYYHKINRFEIEEYEGTVYNINIKDTHTYVTNMGTTLNCHPRDNIALSWLSKELNLSYDWFENVMIAREKQTEWLADLIIKYHKYYKFPVFILGKSFKKETNLTVGSPSILLINILKEKNIEIESYDPYVDDESPKNMLEKQHVYFIGTKHDDFLNYEFPKNSVVLDPWRYLNISENSGIIYIPIGIGK